ncbi:M20/M25/M40 family metallo-hydrolase [Chloroflexota bacterium]
MPEAKVVTFGEIMMRLSPPGFLRFGQARSFDVIYGGGEANVAVSVANFGLPEGIQQDADYSPAPSESPYSTRPNLVSYRRGQGQVRGKSLIVCGHTDVVPADWAEAFTPRLEGDVLYGRGACDDKGPVVAWLLALRALDHFGIQLTGDLETHLVIEEEVGGNGALALVLDGRRADGVIVLEASELNIHPAGRGAL